MEAEHIPVEFVSVREAALRAISPVKPADESSIGIRQLFFARRTAAGKESPPYYLVYFHWSIFWDSTTGGSSRRLRGLCQLTSMDGHSR